MELESRNPNGGHMQPMSEERYLELREVLAAYWKQVSQHANSLINKPDELPSMEARLLGLTRLAEAFIRLENYNFGTCGDCGEEISLAQIRTNPLGLRCYDCEETAEFKEAIKKWMNSYEGEQGPLLRKN